jgi:hypothetical protein
VGATSVARSLRDGGAVGSRGCSGPDDTGLPSTTETGDRSESHDTAVTTSGSGETSTCPAVAAPLASCADTTADLLREPIPVYGPFEREWRASGRVVEVGRGLADLEARDLPQHSPCNERVEGLEVRVEDDDGARWTFGAEPPPGVPDDALVARLAVGTPVDLLVRVWRPEQDIGRAFLLSDASGPILLVEEVFPVLTTEERGASVVVREDEACEPVWDEWAWVGHQPVVVGLPGGEAVLWGGDSVALDLGGRTGELHLTESYY